MTEQEAEKAIEKRLKAVYLRLIAMPGFDFGIAYEMQFHRTPNSSLSREELASEIIQDMLRLAMKLD